MLQVNAGNHPLRQQANNGKINPADQRQPRQDSVDVLRRVAPRPDPRNEPAVLAHVVRKLRGIENDPDVEEREQHDHRDVHDGVERLAPGQTVLEGI